MYEDRIYSRDNNMRISLLVAFVAVILASCVGTAIGVCSGFLGGLADQLIMRFTDAWLSIPAMVTESGGRRTARRGRQTARTGAVSITIAG
jgi:hypothetical protein